MPKLGENETLILDNDYFEIAYNHETQQAAMTVKQVGRTVIIPASECGFLSSAFLTAQQCYYADMLKAEKKG